MAPTHVATLRDLDSADLGSIDPDGPADDLLAAAGVGAWSDARLVDAVAAVIAVPRATEPDSFVLHAPLELLARAALLPHVDPATRAGARAAIVRLAVAYERAAPPLTLRPPMDGASPERLVAAITAGDLDDAAALGRDLGAALDPSALAATLAGAVVPSLAAAAHGAIFLHALPRVAPRSALAGSMLGALARELARHPDWSLTWTTDARPPATVALDDALRATPLLGSPGSNFIMPLMRQVEDTGTAERVVGPAVGTEIDVVDGARRLARVAARSMLEDDPDQSPYGWTHALTIPFAVSGVAPLTERPADTMALAATYLAGFRAGLGRRQLDSEPMPSEVDVGAAGWRDALDGTTAEAAAAARVAATEAAARVALITVLATDAAGHHDAHVVKYTMTCLDAARADPAHAPLFLAAAAHLRAWWRAVDAATRP